MSSPRIPWGRRLGGAALVAATMLTLTGTALADPAPRQARPGSVEYAPTMLVLDASGSMTEADKAGGTKMDSAKRAVNTVVEAAPDAAKVGLTVYGTGTGSSEAEKAAGCQDVQVLKPTGPIDKPGIKSVVDGLNPRGYTPIGKALQTAADALPKEGPRSIVLVSDGIDTCAPPDPCETVKTLAGQGIDLVVHTVGFGVDDAARNQLTCVAQTTGGTYTDAPDAKSLEQTLPRVTASALRNYEPSGTPVRGNEQVYSAPVLPPGEYLDSIGPKGKQYYSVDATPGSTVYFSATVVFPRVLEAGTQWLKVSFYGKDGEQCGWTDTKSSNDTEDGEVLIANAAWDTAQEKEKNNPSCSGPGRYSFAVERESAKGHETKVPLEILVGVEPPVDRSTLPGPATERVSYTDPATPPVPVIGGGTFGTAAALPGSGHYTDQLRFGEFVFYKVKVQWGQTLHVRVRYDNIRDQDTYVSADVKAQVFSPIRDAIATANFTYRGDAKMVPEKGEETYSIPIEYRNRELKSEHMASASIAGDYYIAVKVGQNDDAPITEPVPVTVDVAVSGQPHDPPAYQFANDRQRTDGVFGENASRGAGLPGTPPAAPAGESPFPLGWVLGGSAAGLALLGGAGYLLARRRRPTTVPVDQQQTHQF